MYNTSSNYKLEIKKPSRAFECRVTIGSNVFTNEDIQDIILETTQPQDGYSIGCTPSQTLDLTIINKGLTIYSTNQVKVEIGLKIGASTEYILMGYYNVDDVVKIDYSTKFTCYDNMIKFETPYFSSLGDAPSLTQVVNELATMTGVQFTGSLPSYTVKKLEGFTCREVLSYVASICGGNALITREGKFTIAYLNDSVLSIGTSNYIDYKREEVNFKVGKVSCQVDKNIITKGSLGTDSMELQFENPWVTESILNDIYNRVKSIEYLGYTMKWQGDLSLDPGDLITITDIKGIVRKVPVLSQKFTYTGGLTSEIGGKGESKNKNSFSSSGSNSNKVNRVVTELLIVNEALINKANIKDLEAVSIRTQTIEASVANINHIFAGNITADMMQVGTITAGSGIIANGAIGDLQVSNLSANKLTAGKIDTSFIEVAGANGRLTLKGNRLQVFDSKNGTLFERISLGDVNNDGTKYGLRVRGADGTTILFDENGQTKEGFSDGYNKLTDNSLDSKKLDINSVVRRVNGATEKISSTVVQVGDKTLYIKLSEQTNTITSQGTTLTSHEARISASENSILLKVDTQTYTTNNTTINNQISAVNTTLKKATSDISVIQNQISLKVEQTDITNAVNSIVVGGRNLIKDTSWGNDIKYINTSGVQEGGFYFTTVTELIVDTQYTLSLMIRGVANINAYMILESGNMAISLAKKENLSATAYRKISIPIKIPVGRKWQKLYICTTYGVTATGDWFEIEDKSLNLELGTKATDWTPAPEDTDKAIADTIKITEEKITQAKSEIKMDTDSIKQTVSGVDSKVTTVTTTANSALANANKGINDAKLANDKLTINEQTKLNGQELLPQSFKTNDGTGYTAGSNITVKANVITIVGNQWFNTEPQFIKFDRTKILYWKIDATTSTNNTFYFGIERYDKDKKTINGEVNGATNYFVMGTAQVGVREGYWQETDKSTAYIKLRILNDWGNIGGSVVIRELSWKQLGALTSEEQTTQITTTNNKVATIETNLNSITSRVSNTENFTTTLNGKITSAETRITSAEQKITDSSIISTVQSTINTAMNNANATTDSKLTSYATKASMELTSTQLRLDFSSRGASNLIRNGNVTKDRLNGWRVENGGIVYPNDTNGGCIGIYKPSTEGFLTSNSFKVIPGKTYSLSCWAFAEINTLGLDIYIIGSKIDNGSYDFTNLVINIGPGISKDVRYTFTVPISINYLWIRLDNNGSTSMSSNFVCWFKNLVLVEGNIPSEVFIPNANEIYDGSTVIDYTGVTIKNGALKVLNKYGTETIKANNSGDLVIRGDFNQYTNNGVKSVSISNNQISLYDWSSDGDFVGSIYGGRIPGKNYGYMCMYGDTGNPLYLGCGDMTGIILSNNLEQQSPIYFSNNIGTNRTMSFLNYSGIRYYGNDYSTDLGGLHLGSGNDTWLTGREAIGSSMIGYLRSDDSGYSVVAKFKRDSATIYGSLTVTGSKNRAVNTPFGLATQNAYETAEPLFGDVGEGIIAQDGLCYIFIDPIMGETINTKCSYQVFLQAYGEGICYPIERSETNFIIKGTPNLRFAWEIKAHQKGYENDRLEIIEQLEEQLDYLSRLEEPKNDIDYDELSVKYLDDYRKEII